MATFLVILTILIVLFAGTFPFDFSIPPGGVLWVIQQQFDLRWLQYDPGFIDRGENILFFLPFGFALAANVRPRRWRIPWQLLAAFLASAVLSTTVELSQVLVSFRDPSLQDVWTNTLGGVLGAGLFVGIGDAVLNLAARGLLRVRGLARPSVLGAALAAYALLQLCAPLLIRRPGDLSVWDVNMPLSVGNTIANNRPWEGSVSEIVFADRAITEDEVTRLHQGVEPETIFGKSLLAHYRLLGNGPEYPDLTGQLNPLKWMEKLPDESASKTSPPHFAPDRWISTNSAIESALRRVGKTSELTICVTAASDRPDQLGPARIVTIDNGPLGFDLTLGQEDDDLAIRLRTAIRSAPDLHVRGAFANHDIKQVIVTHKNAQIIAYVDGHERGRVEITPEAKVIWRIYPRPWFRIRIEDYGYRSYATIYRLLVFIPFAALLGALLATGKWSTKTRWIIGAAVTVGMALALEIILGTQATTGFEPRNLVISLVLGFVALAAVMAGLRRRLDWT